MDTPVTPMPSLNSLGETADFRIGGLRVSPSRRRLQGPKGVCHLQPQVMLVFLCLSRREGEVVTRRSLFELCWGGTPVGNDSLNRTLSAVRRDLQLVGADGITIETVPRTGYRMVAAEAQRNAPGGRKQLIQQARDCWRMGLPIPDTAEIAALEKLLIENDGEAADWGVLAILLRKAVEYADADECAGFVHRCEHAARRAFDGNAREANARVALAGVTPLFGNWEASRIALLEVLEISADHPVALHDLAVLEMATGRPSVAAPIIERLMADDRLAATFHYKRMYQLWTLGDLAAAEHIAASAIALWPRHPAIWLARFWILIFTGRADQALRMALQPDPGVFIPPAKLKFLQGTAEFTAARASGDGRDHDVRAHIGRAVEFAGLGPVHAVAALMTLCALDAIDEAFEVARGYYLGQGSSVAPLRWNAGDPCISDQHRRVSQPLFIPAAQHMRKDPRFLSLCDQIGLTAYWQRFGITPDFQAIN